MKTFVWNLCGLLLIAAALMMVATSAIAGWCGDRKRARVTNADVAKRIGYDLDLVRESQGSCQRPLAHLYALRHAIC